MTLLNRPLALRPAYAVGLTSHAVDRFRERFADATLETVAAMILTPLVRTAVAAGAQRIVRSDGMVVCAIEGQVTTVYWREPGARLARPVERPHRRGNREREEATA